MMRFLAALCMAGFFSAPAMAHDIPAVVAPTGICTSDINACGFASICQCDPGYSYSAAAGHCLIDVLQFASTPGAPVTPGACAAEPTGICTRDINPAGQLGALSSPLQADIHALAISVIKACWKARKSSG